MKKARSAAQTEKFNGERLPEEIGKSARNLPRGDGPAETTQSMGLRYNRFHYSSKSPYNLQIIAINEKLYFK